MASRTILNEIQFKLTIERLCYQLIENHKNFSNTAIIGIQPRGVFLANRIKESLETITNSNISYFGKLDNTFYRDDFRTSNTTLTASDTNINFSIEDKRVVLIDDVLYTGRTIRASLDALLDFGRPKDVELMVLIDRRLHRHVPIQAKYIGKTIDSISEEKVKVEWKEQDGKDKIKLVEKA